MATVDRLWRDKIALGEKRKFGEAAKQSGRPAPYAAQRAGGCSFFAEFFATPAIKHRDGMAHIW